MVVSRSHLDEKTQEFLNELEREGIELETVSIGSSLKFCLVAEGEADVYPRFGPTMEWDTAAAHLIATESGCEVCVFDQSRTLTYNKENLRNPSFVVFRKNINIPYV